MEKAGKEAPDFLEPQGIVAVVVGEEKKEFKVHKSLLCHYSPYFRAALTGPFIEAGAQRVDLSEEPCEAFGFFVHWLYAQKIKHSRNALYELDKPGVIAITDLWLLADYLGIPALQNSAIDHLNLRMNHFSCFPRDVLANCWERTRKGSPLRMFLVDSFCFHCRGESCTSWFYESPELFTREVMADIASCLMTTTEEDLKPDLLGMTKYYVKELTDKERGKADSKSG